MNKQPYGFWNATFNQRTFLDNLAKKLNITDTKQWYKINAVVVHQHGGSSLLQKYNGSIVNLLTTVYSEYLVYLISLFCRYQWDLTKFVQIPHGYWDLPKQRAFMDNLAKKLNIVKQEGWYNVTAAALKRHGAHKLIAKYNNSMTKLLSTVYHEYTWVPSQFTCVPRSYWAVVDNQRAFMDNLAKELNITKHEDWYNITVRTMQQHGAGGLLATRHNGSLKKLLTTVYPEYAWRASKFATHAHKGYWDELGNQRSFLNTMAKNLNILEQGGWFTVTRDMLRQHGATQLLNKYGSLGKALATLLPEYKEACRKRLLSIAQDCKLSKIDDLVNVPVTYPLLQPLHLTHHRYITQREPWLLHQHDGSVRRGNRYSFIDFTSVGNSLS